MLKWYHKGLKEKQMKGNNDGFIKRADLRLRERYHGLKTEIYKVGSHEYVLRLLNFTDNIQVISKDFLECKLPMNIFCDVVDTPVESYMYMVAPMKDISDDYSGLCFNKESFECFLISKFLKADFTAIDISHAHDKFTITLYMKNDITREYKEEIVGFVYDLIPDIDEVYMIKDHRDNGILYIDKPIFACTDKSKNIL